MSSRQRSLFPPPSALASTSLRALNAIQVLLLVIALSALRFANGNEVVDEPFISCSADAIYARWKTNSTFTGHVNVRYTPNRFCYQVLITNNQIELLVPHHECNVNRIRSLNPPGVFLETSVLISFHSEFVTAGDRLYVLKCFHTRKEKLDDGRPHTELSSQEPETPKTNVDCRYNVKTEKDGDVAKRLTIGEKVFHEWSCKGAREDQCLLVTNCFLVTHDSKHKLIDALGCSVDRSIVPEFQYVNNTYVGQYVPVFGVAQKPFVHFQCQLSLIDSVQGFCPLPTCDKQPEPTKPVQRRDISSYLIQSNASILDALSQRVEILEVGERDAIAQRPQPPCDINSSRKTSANTEIRKAPLPEGVVCVSKLSFGAVAIATIVVAIFTLVVVLVAMVQRFRGGGNSREY